MPRTPSRRCLDLTRYATHPPLDASVTELEREDLPFNCSHWEAGLESDMRARSLAYLERHYPELTFTVVNTPTTAKPRKRDVPWEFCELAGRPKTWVVAQWRGANGSNGSNGS